MLRVGPAGTLRVLSEHRNVRVFPTCAAAALICIVMKRISMCHPAASTNAAHQHTSKVGLPVCFSVCTITSGQPVTHTATRVPAVKV